MWYTGQSQVRYCCSYHILMFVFFYSVRENKFLFPILDLQGWALVAPGDPWHLAIALGQLGGFFSLEAYAGLPGFHNFRALGSLQFF